LGNYVSPVAACHTGSLCEEIGVSVMLLLRAATAIPAILPSSANPEAWPESF